MGRVVLDELVKMENITMRFPGVMALNSVSFDLRPGEVHVLLGENGAGKSTLVKILSGIYTPNEGTIHLNGKQFSRLSPRESAGNGISVIYQELSVINELSIAENIFVGKLPYKRFLGIPVVDYVKINAVAKELLNRIGNTRNPSTLVQYISISEKQQVEIAKALAADARVIIMDEPTSSLTIEETKDLFKIIDLLKKQGIGIIYISHKLKEIKEIGDRVTVLKDGRYVSTRNVADVEITDLISMMVGRELANKYTGARHHEAISKEIIFSVRNLTRRDNRVRNINFDLYKGEILGFAGLIGAGRSELMESIFGKPISTGTMTLNGYPLKISSSYAAVKKGIALVTEDRREKGFFPNFEIWRNIGMTYNAKRSSFGGLIGLINTRQERTIAEDMRKNLNIRCSGINQYVVNLSGGNQQKVIIGKWLGINPDLFIFDEPTKGIDVGAKNEIYMIMRKMADDGKGVIMVSSELTELLSLCDRIIVMHEGEITAEFTGDEVTEEKIMIAATKTL
jgi:D-allose transport system ATP-binding protein